MRTTKTFNPYKLNAANHLVYKFIGQVQKAIVECNALGLTVEEIEFYHIKPRIIVKDSPATAWLEHSGRAIEYGCGSDENGRHRKLQIMVAGIKVMWETHRERNNVKH